MYTAKLQKNKQKKETRFQSKIFLKISFFENLIQKEYSQQPTDKLLHINVLTSPSLMKQKVINNEFKKWEKVGNFGKY